MNTKSNNKMEKRENKGFSANDVEFFTSLNEAAFDNLVISSSISNEYFIYFDDNQIKTIPKVEEASKPK